jgi:S1-C subfamily serine protease
MTESSKTTSGLLALALVGGGVVGGAAVTHTVWHPKTSVAAAAPTQFTNPSTSFRDPVTTTSDGPSNPSVIAAKVDDAVVDINTTIDYGEAQAAGTGMVLTSTGEVLTNNHVIAGATKISVTDVGNGKTYAATVVGYSRTKDIAVLQLKNASGLATISPASSPVQAGAGVVGVGNAGGQGGTPSYAGGVVVRLGQSITASDAGDGTSEQLTGLIETDANVVAGDSGGPLVDEQGNVVGMDTAASAGYSFNRTADAFAIPIATGLRIAGQIEAGQASSAVHIGPTAMLGVSVATSNGYAESVSGAYIAGVLHNGPAYAAGLRTGDVIIGLAGHPVRSPDDLTRVIVGQVPGTTVTVRYVDGSDNVHTARLRLASGPPQ